LKRAVHLDLDDEDDKNNEMDVSMSSAKENTNITNMLKKQGAVPILHQTDKPNGST